MESNQLLFCKNPLDILPTSCYTTPSSIKERNYNMAKISTNVRPTIVQDRYPWDRLSSNTYNLELTPQEVLALHFVLSNIGGDVTNSFRKHTDSVIKCLENVEETVRIYRQINNSRTSRDSLYTNPQSAIYFNDFDKFVFPK